MKHIPFFIRVALYAFFGLYVLFLFFPEIDADIDLFFKTYKQEIAIVFLADVMFTFGQMWEQRKFRRRLKQTGNDKYDPERTNFTNIGNKGKDK